MKITVMLIVLLFFSLVLVSLVSALGEVTKTSACGGSCPAECASHGVSCTSTSCATTCSGTKLECGHIVMLPTSCEVFSWFGPPENCIILDWGSYPCRLMCWAFTECSSALLCPDGTTPRASESCTYSCTKTQYSCTYDTDKDDDGFTASGSPDYGDDNYDDDPCSVDILGDNCGGTGCEEGSQPYNDSCDVDSDGDGTPDSEDTFPADPCSIIVEGDNCGGQGCEIGSQVYNESCDSDSDGVIDIEDTFPADPCSINASQDNCGGQGCEIGSQPYTDSCIPSECGVYVGECQGRQLCVKLNGNYGLVESCEYDGRCCNIYGFSCIGNDCDLTRTEEECVKRSQANCDKDGCFWDYKEEICDSCLNIYSCSDYNKCDGEMRCNDVCGVALRSTEGCRTGFEMVEGELYKIDTSSCICEWDAVDGCYLTYDRIGGPGGPLDPPITCSDVIESECVGEVLSYTRTITPEGEEPTVITGTGLCGSAASPLPFFSLFNVIGVVMLVIGYYVLGKKD